MLNWTSSFRLDVTDIMNQVDTEVFGYRQLTELHLDSFPDTKTLELRWGNITLHLDSYCKVEGNLFGSL